MCFVIVPKAASLAILDSNLLEVTLQAHWLVCFLHVKFGNMGELLVREKRFVVWGWSWVNNIPAQLLSRIIFLYLHCEMAASRLEQVQNLYADEVVYYGHLPSFVGKRNFVGKHTGWNIFNVIQMGVSPRRLPEDGKILGWVLQQCRLDLEMLFFCCCAEQERTGILCHQK